MTSVYLDIYCNDPDNGLFDNRAAAIQLPDGLLSLEAHDMRGPIFRELSGRIKISRAVYAINQSRDWVGNWCWNRYWLQPTDAVDLLSYVHARGQFQVSEGESQLFNRWKDPLPFGIATHKFLERKLIKAVLAESSAHRTANALERSA